MALTDRSPSFQYNARVSRVVDGDTIICDVDLGFGIWLHGQSFRLLGVNAREHSMEGGPQAASNLRALLSAGTEVVVTSVKNDKYGGRYDARIGLPNGRDLAQTLIQDGWAAAWDGHGSKPLPPWPRTASTP